MALVWIALAFGLVGVLFLVGRRQRLVLEIPPKLTAGDPEPMPRGYWVLTIVGLAALFGGLAVSPLVRAEWPIGGGFAIYMATWVARRSLSAWGLGPAGWALRTIGALLLPVSGVVAMVAESPWPIVGGVVAYVASSAGGSAVSRRRTRRNTRQRVRS